MILEYGDVGVSVAQLQTDLNFCAYGAGEVDGAYGTKTKNAVIRLQCFWGIAQDGIYGEISDSRMMTEIKQIQTALNKSGYGLAADGAVGQATLNALVDFQRKNGLDADGIIGNLTSQKLGISIEPPSPPPVIPPTDPPSGNGNGRTICINPGHGGSDPGAVGNLQEKHVNLEVALRLGKLLTERGFRVVYTRTTDVWMSLGGRPSIANDNNADLFISIHHNGSSSPSSNGTEVICYPRSQNGYRLAQNILSGMVKYMGLYRRGIIQRDDSDVTYSDMPAIITEGCFMSNPNECNFMVNGGYDKEANGILEGILNYFG